MGFLSRTRLKASELMEQSVVFLQNKYNQAAHVFTSASPFGQLLTVIANMAELIFTYIAHTAEELNIKTAQNIETIYGLAQMTGHDAYRGGSAYGMMALKLNTSSDLIEGNFVTINNFTKFTIAETGCTYFLNLPSDYIRLNVADTTFTNVNFIQGIPETQTFTSDGTPLQSFNPIIKNMTDNDNVAVSVNGKVWKRVNSLYDMPADDDISENSECFIAKSSVNVGLSIFFGNGEFGKIPPAGSLIEVTYIRTTGSEGNANTSHLTYLFDDTGVDEYGNEVNLNDVLIVETVAPPMLGSDFEDPEFTKMIAPKASKSFVLATPENYVSYLSKYNQYSFIYAYNTKDDADIYDDNVVYLKIIPNMKKKLSSNQDYFELPANEFTLSEYEKNSIISALDDSGRMLVNAEVQIVDPTVKRFVINIIIRYFEDIDRISIRASIRKRLGQYFLNINRNDIVPLSDIISLVEGIDGVDTCDVFFVNEENERAIVNGYYYENEMTWDGLEYIEKRQKVYVGYDEDPRIGFDNFGNLKVNEYEIFIPKGGWKDRDGNYYTETPEEGKLGPLNIFFIDKVDSSAYNLAMQRKLNTLLKNNY
jgi:hypothetical protein